MDRPTDLIAEHGVDHLMLLDAAQTGEGWAAHLGTEVVLRAGRVDHDRFGIWDRRFDAALEVLRGGHARRVAVARDRSRAGYLSSDADRGPGALHLGVMISLTDLGADKVREYLTAQNADIAVAGLRVGVKGGGCSGFQYQLAFDEQRDGDNIFEDHGLKILVDTESLPYVDGSTIDFVDALTGAGFKVENPNVVAACGCGSSFKVTDSESCSAL